MHIHLVNLDRSPDRLAQFCDLNRMLTSVSRFPAVDGAEIKVDELASKGLVTPDILTMFSVGALGCAMSNLALWDKAIAHNQVVTIAEDDAMFNQDFEPRAEEALKKLPPDWDIIFWGFNFDMFMVFELLPGVTPCITGYDEAQMRQGAAAFQRLSFTPGVYKAIWVFGTCCYSISPHGARTLKEKIVPLRPQVLHFPEAKKVPPFNEYWRTVGIDNCINAVHRQINSYVCFPPLVITRNDTANSTIQVSS